jgi:phenylalanyl-tRNA synthetase beta chain
MLAGDVVDAVRSQREPLIEEMAVFDEYTGPGVETGSRALAFSIVYRAADRTLTDEEVVDLHERVLGNLCADLGVRRRFE